MFAGCNPDDTTGGGSGTPDIVAKYLGTWHVTDNKAKLNYDVTIERNVLYETKVVLNNFAGLGSHVSGEVVGSAVVIDKQTVSGYSVEGTGSYSSNTLLKFSYLLSDGIDDEMRDATFTR
ncbi:MAG: hypothetical protein DRJ09_00060 [Bacteroidetes bacterium]|nr:MAG: hypothetical protein DRJ09_00060 [Bacteroidota bacterium]